METIVISCPECDKQIKAPADAVGKKIRCKSCEHVFVVKAPTKAPAKAPAPIKPAASVPKSPKAAKPAKPVPPPKPSHDDDEDANPYQVVAFNEAPRCPQCATLLEEGAVICLGCGFNTRTRQQARTRIVKETTGQDKFLWLLPGILAILGIILLIGYCFFHYFAWPGILVDGWDSLEAEKGGRLEAIKVDRVSWWKGALIHPALLVFIVVPSLFASFRLGRFAVQRLILHPKPPEVEVR